MMETVLKNYGISAEAAHVIVTTLSNAYKKEYTIFMNLSMVLGEKKTIESLVSKYGINKSIIVKLSRELYPFMDELEITVDNLLLEKTKETITPETEIETPDTNNKEEIDAEDIFNDAEEVSVDTPASPPKKRKKEKKKNPKALGEKKNYFKIFVFAGIAILIFSAAYFINSVMNSMNQKQGAVTTPNISFEPKKEALPYAEENKAPVFVISDEKIGEEKISPPLKKKDINETDKNDSNNMIAPPYVEPTAKEKPKKEENAIVSPVVVKVDIPEKNQDEDIEFKVMGIVAPIKPSTNKESGICDSIQEGGKEYVYFTKIDGTYKPVYEDKYWDKTGIFLNERMVVISIDEENGLTEVQEGKFLPSELFSTCTSFSKED